MKLIHSAVMAAVLSAAIAPNASAQFRPERPYRGIFASGVDAAGQSIVAQASLSGGYDDNVLADIRQTQASGPRQARGGSLAQLSGGVNYALTLDRATVNAGAGASARYYPSISKEPFDAYNARIGGAFNVLKSPNVTLHGTASYQPYTFLSAFPESDDLIEPASAPDPDLIVNSSQFVTYTAGATLTQPLSRRVTFSSSYTYYTANRLERDFWRQAASTRLRFGLTKNLGLFIGYRIMEGHYEDHEPIRTHRPDAGLDFNKALSLTRNTTISFGLGTESTVVKDEVRTRYHGVGNLKITHEIGRSWSVTGIYNRGTFYADTIPEPIFRDSASAVLSGLLTRRIQVQGLASASLGTAGSGAGRNYDIYRAGLSISSAITRFMNVGLNYGYFRYAFDQNVVLDPGVPYNLDRQSIRATITLWAPILNRTRRANATR